MPLELKINVPDTSEKKSVAITKHKLFQLSKIPQLKVKADSQEADLDTAPEYTGPTCHRTPRTR